MIQFVTHYNQSVALYTYTCIFIYHQMECKQNVFAFLRFSPLILAQQNFDQLIIQNEAVTTLVEIYFSYTFRFFFAKRGQSSHGWE